MWEAARGLHLTTPHEVLRVPATLHAPATPPGEISGGN